jgi:hypothetical protein
VIWIIGAESKVAAAIAVANGQTILNVVRDLPVPKSFATGGEPLAIFVIPSYSQTDSCPDR